MRLAGKCFAVLLIGTGLGLLLTGLMVWWGAPRAISDGPWKTALAAGEQTGPYQRAFVAVHGLFSLTPREAIYYTASDDGDGNALDGRCVYQITGREPDARWWSITAYGPDDYLIPNPTHRYSVTNTANALGSRGALAVQVGGETGGENWIPVRPGRFSLMLRLFNPGPAVVFDPAHAVLPGLRKVSCT